MKLATIFALLILQVNSWETWKEKHQKSYLNSRNELQHHKNFEKNLQTIINHNKSNSTYKMGLNTFSDLSSKKFFLKYTQEIPTNQTCLNTFKVPNFELPESVNWTAKGAVTPVKKQEACQASWTFSTTGSLEGQNFIVFNKTTSLSEQNLLDCSRNFGNKGCEGGSMDNAFKYVTNFGIASEEDYPYKAQDEACQNISKYSLKITGCMDIVAKTEKDLQIGVAIIGPISVAMKVTKNFRHYSSGIFQDESCKEMSYLNHAVLVVGYGSEASQDFWLVKNSWGVNWGERGYFRILRNAGDFCGLATIPSYPIL